MPDFLDNTLLWIPLCFGGFWVLRLGLLARVLRSLTWLPIRPQAEAEAEAPIFLRERAAGEASRLEESGFESDGPLCFSAREGFPLEHVWQWRHEEAGTLVWLSLDASWVEPGVARWECFTFLADGNVLETNNRLRELELPLYPGRSVEFLGHVPLSVLWKRHVERVQAHADAGHTLPLSLGAADVEQRMAELGEQSWKFWQADRGTFVESAPRILRLTWSWILRQGVRQLQGATRALKARAKAGAALAGNPVEPPFAYSEEARVELDLHAFRSADAITRARRLGGRPRALISLLSLLVFGAVMTWRDDWKFAIVLTLALLFHELGHLVMMRVFGSRDTSLLFIPFFGGAAVLNDRPAIKPWQEVIMLLAGPIPGIVIGLGLAAYAFSIPGSPPIFGLAAGIVLVFNLFNLVPVMPLDGGQLLNVAFLGRFPRLGALFKGASGILLMVAGWYSGLGILLGILGFFVLLRLPLEWKLAQAHRDLRHAAKAEGVTSLEEEFWLRRIFRRLRTVEFKGIAAAKKQGEAMRLVQVLRHPPARLGTMLLALLGWSSPVWLVLAALPTVKWFGERTLQRVEGEARAGGLPRPEQAAERLAKLRASIPAEQDAGPIYAVVAEAATLAEKAERAKGSAARAAAPSKAETPAGDVGDTEEDTREGDDNARTGASEAGLLFSAEIQATLFNRIREAAQRSHWLAIASEGEAASPARLVTDTFWVTNVVAQELAQALASRDAARVVRALWICRRILEQAAASRGSGGDIVSSQLVTSLTSALETGLARWGASDRPPSVAETTLIAGALPTREWLESQVLPSYFESLPQLEAMSFGWRERLKNPARRSRAFAMPWYYSLLQRFWEYGPLEPKRHAAVLAHALKLQKDPAVRSDPWQRLAAAQAAPDDVRDESTSLWTQHCWPWANAVTRLELARAALAWHFVRASGREVKGAEDLRAPWLVALPTHPLSGRALEFETTGRGGPRVILSARANPSPQVNGTTTPSAREVSAQVFDESWRLTPGVTPAGP